MPDKPHASKLRFDATEARSSLRAALVDRIDSLRLTVEALDRGEPASSTLSWGHTLLFESLLAHARAESAMHARGLE